MSSTNNISKKRVKYVLSPRLGEFLIFLIITIIALGTLYTLFKTRQQVAVKEDVLLEALALGEHYFCLTKAEQPFAKISYNFKEETEVTFLNINLTAKIITLQGQEEFTADSELIFNSFGQLGASTATFLFREQRFILGTTNVAPINFVFFQEKEGSRSLLYKSSVPGPLFLKKDRSNKTVAIVYPFIKRLINKSGAGSKFTPEMLGDVKIAPGDPTGCDISKGIDLKSWQSILSTTILPNAQPSTPGKEIH